MAKSDIEFSVSAIDGVRRMIKQSTLTGPLIEEIITRIDRLSILEFEDMAATDIDGLLESQIEDYRDRGCDVTLGTVGPMVLSIRRVAVK